MVSMTIKSWEREARFPRLMLESVASPQRPPPSPSPCLQCGRLAIRLSPPSSAPERNSQSSSIPEYNAALSAALSTRLCFLFTSRPPCCARFTLRGWQSFLKESSSCRWERYEGCGLSRRDPVTSDAMAAALGGAGAGADFLLVLPRPSGCG